MGLTQAQLADMVNVNTNVIGELERFQRPCVKFDKLPYLLDDIADVLNYDVEQLFPQEYIQKIFRHKRNLHSWYLVKHVPLNELPENKTSLFLPSPEKEYVTKEIVEQIRESLEVLNSRGRELIEYKYGLEDGFEHTLEECGRKFNITRERVRQMEITALGKLKNHLVDNRFK